MGPGEGQDEAGVAAGGCLMSFSVPERGLWASFCRHHGGGLTRQ